MSDSEQDPPRWSEADGPPGWRDLVEGSEGEPPFPVNVRMRVRVDLQRTIRRGGAHRFPRWIGPTVVVSLLLLATGVAIWRFAIHEPVPDESLEDSRTEPRTPSVEVTLEVSTPRENAMGDTAEVDAGPASLEPQEPVAPPIAHPPRPRAPRVSPPPPDPVPPNRASVPSNPFG